LKICSNERSFGTFGSTICHTFASWYKLEKAHISKTGDTAKMIWGLFGKMPVQGKRPAGEEGGVHRLTVIYAICTLS
jgi:hypothetical protein